MKSGRVDVDGQADTAIARYLSDAGVGSRIVLSDWSDRATTGEARIVELEIGSSSTGNMVTVGGELSIKIYARFDVALVDPTFGVIIHDSVGTPLLDLRSNHDGLRPGKVSGSIVVEMKIPRLGLYPGRYLLSPWIWDSAGKRDVDFPRLCSTIIVVPAPGPHGDLKLDPAWGKYFVRSHWKLGLLEEGNDTLRSYVTDET